MLFKGVTEAPHDKESGNIKSKNKYNSVHI